MIRFKTKILQFTVRMGEKTGWSYIRIPAKLAQQLKPDNKKSFRVKGKLDDYAIAGMALIPMGEGDFILALKAAIRKAIRKQAGDSLEVQLEIDKKEIVPPKELVECLADEPEAQKVFRALPKSHQNWYGNWVKSAKTEGTRTRRIAHIVDSLLKKMNFPEMMRAYGEKGRAMKEDR
ncbi:MAG TPA: YdeI/OmpD-associated family protein [Puia sp.]|uniref:YdeI/OmpD-associated family protein n=1 Tax=Puia sp. TaxID=2045100 RepID=UPI002BC60F52|nr:YdeI/OmpD-associated family protein [Puia sp.]HVU96624.1 YdeI/OmpD-associated family protein [Puia sp.]